MEPAKRKTGRPVGSGVKLTPEIQRTIVDNVSIGVPVELACEAAGIGRKTYYRWIAHGKKNRATPCYREFWEAVRQAKAKFVCDTIKKIREPNGPHWTAAAWLLERQFPEFFGNQQQLIQELKKIVYANRKKDRPERKEKRKPPAIAEAPQLESIQPEATEGES